jgi:hypothetical protein
MVTIGKSDELAVNCPIIIKTGSVFAIVAVGFVGITKAQPYK